MQVYEWKAIGRFICYALKCGYFPVKLSYAFMKVTFMCKESVKNDNLVSSFLRDKETIEINLKQFEVENGDELLNVLSSYQCYSKPTKDNINVIICQLAHKELVQRPKYVTNCWATIFKAVKFPDYHSLFLT